MATCKDCIHYDTCKNLDRLFDHKAFGSEACLYFISADVAPKSEVAREIFEEIEELAKIYTFPVVKNGVVEIAKEPFWCIEPNDLAKLKKKYTEDSDES